MNRRGDVIGYFSLNYTGLFETHTASHRLKDFQSKGLALIVVVEPTITKEKNKQISGYTMETEITLSYFATGSTVYFNYSETTKNPTNGEDKFKWTDAEIARIIDIIVRPILVIFGTVGNCLTVYIMRMTSL